MFIAGKQIKKNKIKKGFADDLFFFFLFTFLGW
jgi:hypothetical protein